MKEDKEVYFNKTVKVYVVHLRHTFGRGNYE